MRNRFAWDLYLEATELSGVDSQGAPSIQMLPFLLDTMNAELTQDEMDALMVKIRMIHSMMRAHVYQQRAESLKNGK